MIVNGLRRPRQHVVAVILYPLVDLALLGSCSLAAVWLADGSASFNSASRLWVVYAPLWVGLSFLFLLGGGVYKRVWSRARVTEYVIAGAALAAGIAVCGGISNSLYGHNDPLIMMRVLLYGLFAVPIVGGVRTLPRVIQDAYAYARREKLHGSRTSHNILLYGAGYRATLFLRAKSFDRIGERKALVVVGFVDDDSNLHDRWVHGYPVLGGGRDLDRVLGKHTVDEIVIAADLGEESRSETIATAKAHGVKLSEWRTEVVPVVED